MQILAFDSSAITATVALLRDDRIVSEASSTNRLNHSVRLLSMIDEVLRLGETTMEHVDALAVSVGPGSFTGIRIGLATAKGLLFGTDLLCAPVSTLEALAYNELGFEGIICPVMDARRGEFYNALFKTDSSGALKRLTEDRPISGEALKRELESFEFPCIVCGDGSELFYQHYKTNKTKLSIPTRRVQRAASVACVGKALLAAGGGRTAETLMPLYLRQSGAERKREESEQ